MTEKDGGAERFFHSPNCRRLYNKPGDCPVCDKINAITAENNKRTMEEIRQIFIDVGVLQKEQPNG